MALIPWKNKSQESSAGAMSKQAPARHEMGRFFDRFFNDPFGAVNEFSPWSTGEIGAWAPSLDIAETEKEVTVRAEIPGVDPKDLEVSVTGDRLVLSGEKRESSESHDRDYSHRETRYGSFRREVRVPQGVDPEHVTADYANGVLTIRLQRSPDAAPRRIAVNGA
jgi:HSP20 family protein